MGGKDEKRPLEGGFVPLEKNKKRKSQSLVQILESHYTVTPKPSADEKRELAKITGLDFKQVQAWFGNRRSLDQNGPRVYKPKNETTHKVLSRSFAGKAAERLNNQPIEEAMFSPDSSASLAPCSSRRIVLDPREHEPEFIPFGAPVADSRIPLAFSNRAISDDSGIAGEIKMSSVGSAYKDRIDHQDGMRLPETFNDSEEANRANPGIGQSSGNCKSLGRLKGFGHYVVRPRKTSRSRPGVTDNSETSYFRGDGGSEEVIIAEWNEKEKRAEYAIWCSVRIE